MTFSFFDRLFPAQPRLAANLTDPVAFRHAMRRIMLHPTYLLVLAIPVVLRALHLLPPEVPGPRWFDAVYLAARLAVYVALVIWVEARILRWTFARNIPYVITHYLFFFALAALCFAVNSVYLDPDHLMEWGFLRLMRQQAMVVMLHLIAVSYFGPRLAAAVGRVADLVPIWGPVRLLAARDLRAGEIVADLDGDLLTIQAQNQYVLVRSTTGEVLLRKSLRDTLAGLPMGGGLQVHRSWWVSNLALRRGEFDARDQELRLPDLPAVPVSKTYVPALQERIRQLS